MIVCGFYTLYALCSCVTVQNYIVSYRIDEKLLMLCSIFIDVVLK